MGASDSTPPDLALLIPSYAGGGAERIALFLARTLAERGLRVELVVARSKGELRNEPLPEAKKVELGVLTEFLSGRAWVRYLRKARPRCAMSMVHTANLASGIGAWLVPDVPVIVNLRIAVRSEPAVQWWFRRWFGLWPERLLYRRAARVVGVSKGVADQAVEVLDLPPDKVVSIPNPRVAREFVAEIAPEHRSLFAKPVILGVGRLVPQKDFGLLLHAFADVAAERDLHLVILGEGPERAALLGQSKELGLSERVFLPGFVDNPQAYARRARVFALSSRKEGFPGVLIQAMEAGAAIVSTDCEFGPREILDGDRFGRIVPVGDSAALAEALKEELDAYDVGPEARRAEREGWLRQFDPEVITASYLDLVREVIEGAN